MQDRDLVKIEFSKILFAPMGKVVRLLIKVWEFPNYVPSVKEVSVIQRSHNKTKTKWRIEVNKVPISWIEQDILVLKENTIYFEAIEGDLDEFRGEWRFQEHPEGTLVSVVAYLRCNIPVIKDLAKEYLEKIVRRNFEAILESIETRLVSLRYESLKKGVKEKVAGFGIIGHLYNFYHLEKCLKMLNPNFKMPSREFLGQLFHITPSFKLFDILNFKSKTGQVTRGCFIVATFIPEMIEKDVWTIFSKVVKACKIAEKYGVGIVALGGFTSIVAERIGHQISDEVDVPVTTGNTFTAAMAIDGVLKASSLLNLDLAQAKATIVGGTGDIGSACARVLVDKVRQLTITGRTKSNLHRLKQELAKRRKAQVYATTDNEAAIKDADIIIAAASATSSILKIDWFKSGSIICDVGYPKNVSYAPTTREDILIFSGGLTKPPTPVSFPIDIGLPSADAMYGCFAEAIILALERRYENFSFGRGNITPEKIDIIRDLGRKHGFSVSDFWWGNRLIDSSIIERIKEAVRI
jgi:predicted amino acid dehydrogenase/ribosome-associated toxin RatA of RatAB toxin-antitoxin module